MAIYRMLLSRYEIVNLSEEPANKYRLFDFKLEHNMLSQGHAKETARVHPLCLQDNITDISF